jgi:hypothetical protein
MGNNYNIEMERDGWGSKIVLLMSIRASTISPSQLATRIKIIYLCLVGGERRGERM